MEKEDLANAFMEAVKNLSEEETKNMIENFTQTVLQVRHENNTETVDHDQVIDEILAMETEQAETKILNGFVCNQEVLNQEKEYIQTENYQNGRMKQPNSNEESKSNSQLNTDDQNIQTIDLEKDQITSTTDEQNIETVDLEREEIKECEILMLEDNEEVIEEEIVYMKTIIKHRKFLCHVCEPQFTTTTRNKLKYHLKKYHPAEWIKHMNYRKKMKKSNK